MGIIKFKDYRDFISFSSGCCGIFFALLICIITSLAQLAPSLWLTRWLENDLEEQQKKFYPIVFASIIAFYILVTMLRSIVIFKIIINSATSLHNKMTECVLRAKILFFDSNPIGRIVTRFSKDLAMFDVVNPILVIITAQGWFRMVTVVITLLIVNYYLAPLVIILAICCYFTMRHGRAVMIESQRRDSESRTPIHSTFAMVINGLVSLRAMEKFGHYRREFDKSL